MFWDSVRWSDSISFRPYGSAVINLLNSKLNVRMGKKGDLSNFEHGARRAGLSISQSAQLLGFSRTTISRDYKEWCEKGKTSSMQQSCG